MADPDAASPAVESHIDEVREEMMAIQDAICDFIGNYKGVSQAYHEDAYDYDKGEGGGRTRVFEGRPDQWWEKGAVNFSCIRGPSLPASVLEKMDIAEGTPFWATGVSVIIHPWNPRVPTVHMNVRYLEVGSVWWFGGGIDVTPYYPDIDEVVSFHALLRDLCDDHGEDYERHKAVCDKYFYLKHRKETRGVGGLFFDRLSTDFGRNWAFTRALGRAFPDLYANFLSRIGEAHTEAEREFQLYRRGRYVEFNLLFDRGTKFGIESDGRTESILVSMPATVRWRYNWEPEAGTLEARLYEHYLKPQDWLGLSEDEVEALRLDLPLLVADADPPIRVHVIATMVVAVLGCLVASLPSK